MGGEIEVVDSGGERAAHDDFRAGGDVEIIDGGVGAKVDAAAVDVSDAHSIAGICAANRGVAQQSELSADVFVGGLEGQVGAVVQAHVGETNGAGDVGRRALAIGGEHAAVEDVDGGGDQIDQR